MPGLPVDPPTGYVGWTLWLESSAWVTASVDVIFICQLHFLGIFPLFGGGHSLSCLGEASTAGPGSSGHPCPVPPEGSCAFVWS